ncbi:MAG: hypothetical protein PF636_06840 [Actinomycetota bacterium]|jgi:hypothetical protein|nr:hypothetical protein [Actinomycetota bacterium]
MESCELTEGCIFFNDKMTDMPSMANMYKKRYCHGDFAQCARFRVFSVHGRESVPADMFPNNAERAEEMVAD